MGTPAVLPCLYGEVLWSGVDLCVRKCLLLGRIVKSVCGGDSPAGGYRYGSTFSVMIAPNAARSFLENRLGNRIWENFTYLITFPILGVLDIVCFAPSSLLYNVYALAYNRLIQKGREARWMVAENDNLRIGPMPQLPRCDSERAKSLIYKVVGSSLGCLVAISALFSNTSQTQK